MNERQLRYRLRKEGYLLQKRDDGFMIVDMFRNYVVASGYPFAYSFSFDDVLEWLADFLDESIVQSLQT